MILRILYINICILSILSGCQKKIMNRGELYTYIQNKNHGVFDSKENNGVKVSMSYIPGILMRDNADSTLLGKYLYFRLTYQINDKDMLSAVDQSSYSVLVNRLSFKLGDYIIVRCDGKDEEIADFQFSPMYGATNNTEVVIALDRDKLKDEKELTIKLRDIGLGLPEYDFTFKREALERLDDLTVELEKLD